MRNQASREIFDYWIKLCGDQPAPLRTDIDPMVLRRLLPHLFIVVEPDAAEADDSTLGGSRDAIFRLAGTRICDLFGCELKGRSFRELWSARESLEPLDICRTVIRDERPAVLDVQAQGLEHVRPYEMLLLPVRSGTGSSDRTLGALVPEAGKAFPLSALPVEGLVLQNWSFLERDGAETPDEQNDRPSGTSVLWRLLSLANFSASRPS